MNREENTHSTGAPVLRNAGLTDIPILSKHRRWMFEEMAALAGRTCKPAQMEAMEQAYSAHLAAHLEAGTMFAWVVEQDSQVVASGALSLVPWPPGPYSLSGQMGHLHSVYTQPACRGQGLARTIVCTMIAFSRQLGLQAIMLQASEAGRPLYASLGFQPAQAEMRLALK